MAKVDNAKSLADFYSRIFTSEPFTFLVGDSKSKITVNGAAIAQLSPALDALVNGSTKGAHVKPAEIQDVTVEEFVRFCQFAYTGDYSPVQPKQVSEREHEPEPEPEPTPSEQEELTPVSSNRNASLHDEAKEDGDETWPASPVIKKYGKKGTKARKSVDQTTHVTPKADSKTDTRAEKKTELKTDLKTEKKGDPKTDPKTDVKTDVKTDLITDQKTEKKATTNGHHGVNGTSARSIWDSLSPPNPPQSPESSAYSPFGSKKDNLRSKFDRREYCTTTPKQLSLSACEPIRNTSPEEDYRPVLLGHARLYVLGEKYDIPSLRNLALYKLHKTLVVHTLHDDRFVDIVDLAKFVYNNTNDKADEPLRSLVVEYVACEIEMIGKAKEFDQLMEEGGPFVRDLWKLTRTNLL